MSRKERSTSPRKPVGPAKNAKRRMPDLRIRRTRGRLSNALVELMRDKPIHQITVQEVLEQAGVGRSTFYLHYCDKDDLLLDLMENGMEMWSNALSKTKEKSHRLVPVEEFFSHAGSAMQFYRALIDSGCVHAFFDLAQLDGVQAALFVRAPGDPLHDCARVDCVDGTSYKSSRQLGGVPLPR